MKFSAKIQPWYRKHDGWWYLTRQINGKRVQEKLAKGEENREVAYQRFHQIMAQSGAVETSDEVTFNELAFLFLSWAKCHCSAETLQWYRNFITDFDTYYQGSAAKLTKGDVQSWLQSHDWSVSTQRQAITCIKRVINHAFEENHLRVYPEKLKGLKRPPMGRRDVVLTADQRKAILDSTDAPFRMFLTALAETGCRPGEVRSVTAKEVDLELGVWVFRKHKTAEKTNESRIVYLTPTMLEITRNLVELRPTGPLFLNSRNQPWTRNAVRCRMRKLREKLGLPKGTVAYSYRHSFVTDGLENGVPLADLAEILGHKDTRMILEHYSKLRTRVDHLRKAAEKATA